MTLSPLECSVLEFERLRWRYPGAKDDAIWMLFGMSWPRYVQLVQALIDRPDAEEWDPVFVQGKRRLRDARKRDRASKGQGFTID